MKSILLLMLWVWQKKLAISSTDAKNWVTAMHDKMVSLEKNGTWDLVKLPKEKKTIC
jgi:hypothetical protein